MTKLAQCAKGVVDHTRDGLDQTVNQFVDSSEGVVSGGLRCAGDVVHGHFDRLGKDGLSVAGDALNVGMCLTPEGVAESVGAMSPAPCCMARRWRSSARWPATHWRASRCRC